MNINITLMDIIKNIQFLNEVAAMKMPAKTAYKFAKLIKIFNTEYEQYDTERGKLLRQYGKKDANGNIIFENNAATFEPGKYEEFEDEMNGLLGTNIEINIIPFELDEIAHLDFTPIQMIFMDNFIKG